MTGWHWEVKKDFRIFTIMRFTLGNSGIDL
jgi:hypothetical protein